MKTCPGCQHPIQGTFGMVMCGSCGVAVFIDLDGNPQLPTALDESSDAIEEQEPRSDFEQPVEPHVEPLIEQALTSEVVAVEVADFSDSTIEAERAVDFSLEQPMDQQLSASDQYGENQEPLNGEDLIGDVLEFANKPTSEVVGSLSYLIVIRGIDTIELKKTLLEELRDKKFGWNINEIESRIEAGVLILKELSPVQATLIVKRIRPLPLVIQWKQIL